MKLLSVIMPTYNRLSTLKITIPILLEQVNRYPELAELVICNNASTDGTIEYINKAFTGFSFGISNDVVSCIIRLMNINSEELTEEQLRNMRQAVNPIGIQLKKQLGIPSSVQFVLIVQDKNGKRI